MLKQHSEPDDTENDKSEEVIAITTSAKGQRNQSAKLDDCQQPPARQEQQQQQQQQPPSATRRNMAPMTREQYETLQSQIREEYDPETGRNRLVRGTGEIIERIVSRSHHQAINRQATYGDGAFFHRQTMSQARVNANAITNPTSNRNSNNSIEEGSSGRGHGRRTF